MMNNFSKEDISHIRDIISRYQEISGPLLDYQKQAEEIQKKVNELNSKLDEVKKEETEFMEDLHKRYGDFSLQDVYDAINK